MLVLAMTLGIFAAPSSAAAGTAEVSVYADGEKLSFPVPAFRKGNEIYVPAVKTALALGADKIAVDRDDDNHSAEIIIGGETVMFRQGAGYVETRGRAFKTQNAYIIKDDTAMIPVRPLCLAFGAEMSWNGNTKTLFIGKNGKAVQSGDEFYDKDDLLWLSRIINAEARGESLDGKIAVGNVIMNRVRSPLFPNDVREVIFDRNGGIQFSPTRSGAIYEPPSDEAVIAAKLVLEGTVVTKNAIYFSPAYRAENSWAGRHRTFDMQIDGHVFYS